METFLPENASYAVHLCCLAGQIQIAVLDCSWPCGRMCLAVYWTWMLLWMILLVLINEFGRVLQKVGWQEGFRSKQQPCGYLWWWLGSFVLALLLSLACSCMYFHFAQSSLRALLESPITSRSDTVAHGWGFRPSPFSQHSLFMQWKSGFNLYFCPPFQNVSAPHPPWGLGASYDEVQGKTGCCLCCGTHFFSANGSKCHFSWRKLMAVTQRKQMNLVNGVLHILALAAGTHLQWGSQMSGAGGRCRTNIRTALCPAKLSFVGKNNTTTTLTCSSAL